MKKIGLQVDLNEDYTKPLFNFEYFTFCQRYGAVHLIHPYDEVVHDLDLLVLIGGRDLLPNSYGVLMDPRICGRPNYDLEYFDQKMLPEYIKKGVPVWGTCRGAQRLNCTGAFQDEHGTLLQHTDDEPTSQTNDELVHFVKDIITNQCYPVNSRHHQKILKLHPKYDISLMGFSVNKKRQEKPLSIEGIRGKDEYRKCAGVQFHPEDLQHIKYQQAIQWVDTEINRIISLE